MKYKDPITGEYKELFLKASDTLPIGVIVPYGSDDIPTNWLLCDGSAVSRTTYASLFSVIGTNFGEGDGETTFNLPDFITQPSLVTNYIIKSGMSVGVVGNVVNEKTDSSKDTYSCEYINNLIKKSIITGYYSGNIANTGSISFNSFVKNGEKINGLEEKITVTDLSKVKVSASITVQTSTSQTVGLAILKNDTLVWQSVSQSYSTDDSQIEITIPPILVEVSDGDEFKLSIAGSCTIRKSVMTLEEVVE